MFEQSESKVSLKSRIIGANIKSFCRRYQKRDSIYRLFQMLLDLIEEDSFLALDSCLIEKIRMICTALIFRYPDDDEIRTLRRKILRELSYQESILDENKEKIVQKLIEKEKDERKIPNNFDIGKEEVLEMYRRDYENYVAIIYKNMSIDNLSLFYYLTTVNKIYTNTSSDFIERNRVTILYVIMKQRRNFLWDEDMNNYIRNTELRICSERKKKVKAKVIQFPK